VFVCLFVCFVGVLFCENESLVVVVVVEEEETLKPAFLFPLLVCSLFCRRRRRRRRRREQKEEEEEEEEEEENSNSNNSCGEEDEEAEEEEEDAWSLNVDCLGASFLKCHYWFALQQSVGGIIFFLLLAQRRFCRGTCVATFLLFCFVCAFSVLRLDILHSRLLACWKEGSLQHGKFACILAFLLA